MWLEFQYIYKYIEGQNKDLEAPVILFKTAEDYIKIFHVNEFDDLWSFIMANKFKYPLRMMISLMAASPSYNNLKR